MQCCPFIPCEERSGGSEALLGQTLVVCPVLKLLGHLQVYGVDGVLFGPMEMLI
jgi:hypothetical protein